MRFGFVSELGVLHGERMSCEREEKSLAVTNHKQIVRCQWVGFTILAKSRLKF